MVWCYTTETADGGRVTAIDESRTAVCEQVREGARSVQIQLFGGVAAIDRAGRAVDVGPAKCQAVLAALALSAGTAVPVARIVELVWGTSPPRTAEKTLQSYVTRLRKGLGSTTIERVGAAYRMDVDPDAVDVLRFQHLLAEGDATAALDEWTGPPLAGLEVGGLTAVVEGIVEQWLGAVERDLEARLDNEPSPAVVGTLTELTGRYPFREGLWALLMTALYRDGRQADALAAYRTARHRLIEGLGVEPGPRLRELESLILGHDERLQTARPGIGGGPGERPTGTVTFGFTDVTQSAQLWATDRRAMAAAIERHERIVGDQAERHGGVVFATGNDALGVAFHRASDGLAWASDTQRAIDDERWPGDLPLRLGIGLHTGETEERGKGYFGPAVIVAARLSAMAAEGQTLVSGAASMLVDGRGLRELGTYRLDGVVTDQQISQIGDHPFPPLRTDDRRGNLPRRVERVVGREGELDRIASALAESPIVTLVGPGGIGKTRLALEAARHVDDNVAGATWLVELASIGSSAEVAPAVALALDLPDRSSADPTEAIVRFLERRGALLALDNCEHVIDGAAALAAAVVERCSDVHILATSREGLGLDGERLIAVPPLEIETAGVELFLDRAAAVSGEVDSVADRAGIEEICRRLDGVPLAIELAAARTRSLSIPDLVARLDDRLRLLTGGRRGSVERHRTLRATIQWSYDLLTPLEQRLFERLSIFAGPFDLGAATLVGGGSMAAGRTDDRIEPDDVDPLLGALVDRSMVVAESGPFGRRFRLLETMRQFGIEFLSARGETDRVADRHAAWMEGQVADIRVMLAGHEEVAGVARLDERWTNLRAAVDWTITRGEPRRAIALFGPVVTEIYVRSRSEIGDWAERVLAITPADDLDTIRFCMIWAARRLMRRMDREGFERLVAAHPEIDAPMLRYADGFLSDDRELMVATAPDVVDELRSSRDDYGADLFEVVGSALSLLLAGRNEPFDELAGELVERFRENGPPTCLHWILTMMGSAALAQGRSDEAFANFDESMRIHVPPRTHTLRNPLQASREARAGRVDHAVALLADYVHDLLSDDNLYVAGYAALQYVEVMARAGRFAETGAIVGYLDHTGLGPAFTPRLDELVDEMGHRPELPPGPPLDHRAALEHILATLEP